MSLTGIITAEGTVKLKTSSYHTHSAQLLSPYPSGLPLSLSHYSELFLIPITHSQLRAPCQCSQSIQAYYDSSLNIDW